MTVKQTMLEIAQSAPDDIEWDEILDWVFLKARIHKAEEDKAGGLFYTTEEMLERVFPCDTPSSG